MSLIYLFKADFYFTLSLDLQFFNYLNLALKSRQCYKADTLLIFHSSLEVFEVSEMFVFFSNILKLSRKGVFWDKSQEEFLLLKVYTKYKTMNLCTVTNLT